MSMFVGNTFTRVDDVRSLYSTIDSVDSEDIAYTYIVDKEFISKEDFDNRIQEICDDVNSAIKTIESYDVSSGLDELKILAEKLY